eukprot:TRINITY_DN11011_c0_g1_i2.p1 TRINITY_DN11011_c0_g1~~TRINITY_DN11011_c0_g1_i2.p1  ORF type:complete len:273 (+),score=81.22 TRINITY_DN11011_c0_g1_i2:192-1010(+)
MQQNISLQNQSSIQQKSGQQTLKQREEAKKDDKLKFKRQEILTEEEILQIKISTAEETALNKVFAVLSNGNLVVSEQQKQQLKEQQKDQKKKEDEPSFDTNKLIAILTQLNYPIKKPEIEQMVWEIDEDLDQKVDYREFMLMYITCRRDDTYLEPRSIYNVVQFLMYLLNNQTNEQSEKDPKTMITVEDTLELLYVKYGRNQLDEEIEEIFGKDENKKDGEEKKISLSEYLEKVRKKDKNKRKLAEENRKILLDKTSKKDKQDEEFQQQKSM